MSLRRILGFILLAVLIFFVLTQPVAAAGAVQAIAGLLLRAAQSVTTFFTTLF